jgi:hypothetical protein
MCRKTKAGVTGLQNRVSVLNSRTALQRGCGGTQYTLVLETSALIGMRVELPPSPPSFAGMAKRMTRLLQKQLPRVGAGGSSPPTGTKFYGESTSRVLAAVANRMEPTGLAVGMSALRHFGK